MHDLKYYLHKRVSKKFLYLDVTKDDTDIIRLKNVFGHVKNYFFLNPQVYEIFHPVCMIRQK